MADYRPFEKMQGIGNDFVVVAAHDWPAVDWSRMALSLCDRHFGVGSDGLLVVEPSEQADYRMRMFNPDGTEDDCGNGLRCVARYVRQRFTTASALRLETLSGVHDTRILEHDERQSIVRIEMGHPLLAPADIPMAITADRAVDYPIDVAGTTRLFTCLYTGSTHAVTFLEGPVEDAVFFSQSPLIENHPLFPQRTSVLWAWPEGQGKFHIRIWERGVGETSGCGTGACAVGVAAGLQGRTSGPTIITSRGGRLQIEWEPGSPIRMTGPAVTVYEGRWPL